MEFDLVVIGAGPGGYYAAIRGSQLGAKVSIVEKELVGGTCLNRGCIPTKALYASARAISDLRRSPVFGINAENISFDYAKMVERKDAIVSRLGNGVERLLRTSGVDLIHGSAFIDSPNMVRIKMGNGEVEETIKTKKIIIATGSRPRMIPSFNIDGRDIITSTEALDLVTIPKSLLVIGGGVTGCEFANMFAIFGSNVILVESLPAILSTEEKEVSCIIAKRFRGRGVEIHTAVSVEGVKRVDSGVLTTFSDGRRFITEKVIVATGRSFNTQGIGLEKIGVQMKNERVIVNDKMETNIEGVYAVGDIVGGMLLAHVASMEGIVAANNALGRDKRIDYSAIPSAVFTDPEVASVGMREDEARERGIKTRVGRFPYAANGKAVCAGEEDGYVKIVSDAETDRVIGFSIIGTHATDLIGEAAIVVKAGLSARDVMETVQAHPTLSEMIPEAAADIYGYAINKVRKRG